MEKIHHDLLFVLLLEVLPLQVLHQVLHEVLLLVLPLVLLLVLHEDFHEDYLLQQNYDLEMVLLLQLSCEEVLQNYDQEVVMLLEELQHVEV